jgi:ornithine cyclodeaminase/alanine dehydrogenase
VALILTRDDVKSVLTMKDCIEAVEEAFKQFALGNVVMPTRPTIRIPKYKALINAMPAYIGGMDAVGVKLVGGYLDNPTLHGLPVVQAVIVLNDGTNGSTLAVMDGTYVTAVRTGAASGVATKYLARADATTVAVIGAGVQARTQLAAVCEVRPIVSARVFAREERHRDEYAVEMSRALGIEVTPAGSAEEAVTGADIVCTASTSKSPVLEGAWLEQGVHVNCAGSHSPDARELDTATVVRSTVVVDSRDAALAEAGDLMIPIANGDITEDHIRAELGEVVAGTKPGRTDPGEITLFKSQGLAIQDVATASLVYRLATEKGIGQQVAL